MFDYDANEEQFDEAQRELYEKTTGLNAKKSGKTALLILSILGIAFIIAGIICFRFVSGDGEIIGTIFLPLGAFYIVLGLIIGTSIPKAYTYEKYVKRKNKTSMQSVDSLDRLTDIAMLEQRVAELEKKVAELEGKKDSIL